MGAKVGATGVAAAGVGIGPGVGEAGGSEPDARAAGLAVAAMDGRAVGTAGAHPASVIATDRATLGTRAAMRRLLARPETGRGAESTSGGMLLIAGRRPR